MSRIVRSSGPIAVEIGYDEFDIDVTMTYPGRPLEMSGQLPTHDEILETEEGPRRLAAFPDHAAIRQSEGDGRRRGRHALALHFRH